MFDDNVFIKLYKECPECYGSCYLYNKESKQFDIECPVCFNTGKISSFNKLQEVLNEIKYDTEVSIAFELLMTSSTITIIHTKRVNIKNQNYVVVFYKDELKDTLFCRIIYNLTKYKLESKILFYIDSISEYTYEQNKLIKICESKLQDIVDEIISNNDYN